MGDEDREKEADGFCFHTASVASPCVTQSPKSWLTM
jgi:hypothetical protein